MKQQIKEFCEQYIIDLNGKQAAIRAGYASNSAEVQASRLLSSDKVKEYIAELRADQVKRTKVSADDVIKEFAAIAFADIRDYYETVYMIHYIQSDDKKGKRVKAKYGGELTVPEFDELRDRYKVYYSPVQRLKDFNELTPAQRSAIAGVSYDKAGNKILKLNSKQSSLDSLAKHLGMYIDKKEIDHKGQIIKRVIKVNPTKDK